MKRIILVKCESNSGNIEKWIVTLKNGKVETYSGHIPPSHVARFCMNAIYRYSLFEGSKETELFSMTDSKAWRENND